MCLGIAHSVSGLSSPSVGMRQEVEMEPQGCRPQSLLPCPWEHLSAPTRHHRDFANFENIPHTHGCCSPELLL